MAKHNRPLAFGSPDSAQDRLQADAVLVCGPDLDRFIRVLGRFLCDHRGQLFSKAALSSGVAEAGWRGRGFCTDQPIAFSASQPRCGATPVRPPPDAPAAAPPSLSPAAPPSRAAAPPASALTLKPSRRPPLGWSTAPIGRGLTQAVL